MSNNQISMEMIAKDAGVVRILEKIEKAMGKQIDKINKVEKASKQSSKRVTEDQKRIEQIIKQTTSSADKYRAKFKELDRLHKEGKLPLENYRKAVADLKNEQKKASPTYIRQQKLLADAKKAIEASLTPQQKYANQVKQLMHLKKQGVISQEQYAQAVRKEATAYKQLHPSVAKLKQVESERNRIQGEANRVVQASLSPRQKYAQQVKYLISLKKQGALTEQQYSQALKKESDAFKKLSPAVRRDIRDKKEAKRLTQAMLTPEEKRNKNLAYYSMLLRKGRINQETFNRAVRRQNEGLGKAEKGIGGIASAMSRWVTIGGSVYLMLNQVRREYENIKTVQRETLDTQLSVAEAQKGALFNLSEEKGYGKNELIRDVQDIASKGVSGGQAAVYQAVSAALSFKGGLSNEDAVEAVRVAFEQEYDNPEAATTLSSAILSLKKAVPNASAKQIAGQFIASKQKAAIIENEAFAQNFAPGVANLMSFGGTPSENESILSVITQGVGDKEGRVSRNAGINFARQLALELPNLGSTLERIQYIQSDAGKEIRGRLLGAFENTATDFAGGVPLNSPELSGEAKAYTTLIGMLQSGTEQANNLNLFLKEIPKLTESEGYFTSKVEEIKKLALQQSAISQYAVEGAIGNIQVGNIEGGRGAISREALTKLIKATGNTELQSRLDPFIQDLFSGGQPSLDRLITSLEDLSKTMKNPQTTDYSWAKNIAPAYIPDQLLEPRDRPPTEQEKRNAEQIDKLIRIVESQSVNREVKVKIDDKGKPGRRGKSEALSR